ncbi:hybrid sensor histidine kinase/response regulator [Geomesophilobacter sediminis]|uniref:Chemotaxis protein CheA n=1 Tax=Geomesophilobacter sediminis TaxID=2798584 RepID=A0A8J7M1V4_9BACT|nr:hybrid sensor histidine kinase/response regulator [Geomesophilobacter sediminis]MBJ6727140.1 hybrid sensor histidine kinase/response regulator [Geomesophilobacter sediminis]
MAFDPTKFLMRFVEEAREHCSRLSEGLLALESEPEHTETINALFRAAHTVKGSAKMMKLSGVTELAHHMEDLLDAARDGKTPLDKPRIDLLFRSNDALLALLDAVSGGNTAPVPPQELCALLADAVAPAGAPPAAEATPSAPPPPAPPPAASAPPASAVAATDPATADAVHDPAALRPAVEGGEGATPQPAVKKGAEYLRINANKLDELIQLMGEIVSEHRRFSKDLQRLQEIERSCGRYHGQVAEHLGSAGPAGDELKATGEALYATLQESVRGLQQGMLMQEHLVVDLQETSLKMRMLPLSTVFDPLRRTFRDLARESGREIDLVVTGGDTELDRKIIDRIGDALVHLVSNAINHGIESAEDRLLAGKPVRGTVTLSACYDGGCVTITLSDDGSGMSVERIREKALAKRLIDPESAATMPRADLINLIFLPGFSTSAIITDRTGRGVGMDVVKKSIVDESKGTIFVDTREGVGTSFMLRLPLNLAVFPVLQVIAAGKTCALPNTSIVEMLRAPAADLIEVVNKRAIRLREQLIPVEPLAPLVGLSASPEPEEVLIVIVRDGEEKLGLIIDEALGSEEMVIKPLPDHLQNLKLVSGVTIGDRNAIINLLHVPELLKQARNVATSGRRAEAENASAATILVVDDSYNTRELEKSILEANGYQVETAFDGEDGFGKTREHRYDLIITDVEMPRLDGFSLTERLRADERYHTVPIVIVTSREKEADKKRGISVGADAYIVKGAFDQSNLIDTVRALIG